jgi:hypothetical protein
MENEEKCENEECEKVFYEPNCRIKIKLLLRRTLVPKNSYELLAASRWFLWKRDFTQGKTVENKSV